MPARTAKQTTAAPPRRQPTGDVTEKVYAVIARHPGNIAAAIDEIAGVTSSQGATARKKLLAAGRIRAITEGRTKTFVPTSSTEPDAAMPTATAPTGRLGKGELLAAAVALLKERGDALTPGAIGRILGRDPHAIQNALDRHGPEHNCPRVSDKPVAFQHKPPAKTDGAKRGNGTTRAAEPTPSGDTASPDRTVNKAVAARRTSTRTTVTSRTAKTPRR
jgi:hypothetical protein